MTIQEIRVGNYVMHESYGICVAESIHGAYQEVNLRPIGALSVAAIPVSDCQPVPLSLDILEAVAQRFRDGFLLTGTDSAKPSVFLLVYDDTQFKVFINWNYIGIISIRSFHQLQNIIHSLTGTELEYKEPVKG